MSASPRRTASSQQTSIQPTPCEPMFSFWTLRVGYVNLLEISTSVSLVLDEDRSTLEPTIPSFRNRKLRTNAFPTCS